MAESLLAYDLFRLNAASKSGTGKGRLVKKVYVNGSRIKLDTKTLEEYGSDVRDRSRRALSELLSMPSDTSPWIGLPDESTGTSQRRPYVDLYGIVRKKHDGSTFFSIGKSGWRMGPRRTKADGKQPISFKATLDASIGKRLTSASGHLCLKMDRAHYFIGHKNLFQMYVESGILNGKGEMSANTFKTVCDVFFEYVEGKNLNDLPEGRTTFSLIVLPSDQPVLCPEESHMSGQNPKGFDAFGRPMSHFPSKPTRTAKFMSYDDPAFALNLAKREKFYGLLSIGDESQKKINIPADAVLSISGLSWIFADITDPTFEFERTGKGIYHQVWRNYELLKDRAGDSHKAQSQMKVVCYKKTYSKIEILIDENLTMDGMRQLFSGLKEREIVPLALELLIQEQQRSVLWSDYIGSVRAFVANRRVDDRRLIQMFLKRLRMNLFEWLEKPSTAKEFYRRSEFCLKVLSGRATSKLMDGGEDFAYRTGKIAGSYVRFKERVGESSNSLKDILAYSRYDREKLRFVIQRVGRGISLSDAKDEDLSTMADYIKREMPAAEIPDGQAHNDYSYFFYRGAFEQLGGIET